ncbi:growth/differentiation factor 8-like [Babylonia areolata]|uniref:growth/differentiation factor 8-like n=1 Tax=Babylonia areolata TaxID=304850 RepID=UPI003FD40D3E
MSDRGRWTPGNGYLWLAVCLLLLCLPPSFPALVFPNDVLADLDKYRTNSNNYENLPKAKSASPVLYSSSGAPAPFHTDRVPPPLPSQTTPVHHSYPSLLEGTSLPSSKPSHHPYPRGSFKKDLFHSLPSVSEESVEDYGDYSHSPLSLSQPELVDPAPNPNPQGSVPSRLKPPRHHHSSPHSVSGSLEEKGSIDHKGDSQEKAERARGKSESAGKKDHVHGERSGHSDSSSKKEPVEEEEKQCPRCKIREGDRAYRIESLKKKILESLRFDTLPNRTGMPVPKALAHMTGIHTDLLQDAPYGGISHQLYDDEDEDYTPPERVFTTAKPMPPHLGKEDNRSCYFTMPGEVFRSRVTKAFLWFYVRHSHHVQSTVIQMRVARLGPSFSKKQRPSRRVVWSQKDYPKNAFGWKKVEMTNVVRRWVKHPSSNFGLQILAMNGDENLAVVPPTSAEYNGYEPMLDIKVTKNAKRRYRRSDSLTCSENTTEHRCCRYPLTVSFAEFGWDWVIAPTHVKADYCSGECRMTLQNKTPYSWITSQMPDGGGGSCCTPSKMSALPLLYFDQSSDVVFQMLQNMRVERCGCA